MEIYSIKTGFISKPGITKDKTPEVRLSRNAGKDRTIEVSCTLMGFRQAQTPLIIDHSVFAGSPLTGRDWRVS